MAASSFAADTGSGSLGCRSASLAVAGWSASAITLSGMKPTRNKTRPEEATRRNMLLTPSMMRNRSDQEGLANGIVSSCRNSKGCGGGRCATVGHDEITTPGSVEVKENAKTGSHGYMGWWQVKKEWEQLFA